MALGVFGVEGLVDGEVFVLQGKDLVALDVGEDWVLSPVISDHHHIFNPPYFTGALHVEGQRPYSY